MEKKFYKYQLVQYIKNQFHAGSKAPQDVSDILNSIDFKTVYIRNTPCTNIFSRIYYFMLRIIELFIKYVNIKKDSIIVIQYPKIDTGRLTKKFLTLLKKKKNAKIVTLIHDINELRSEDPNLVKEYSFSYFFKNTDYFISHNYKMTEYLVTLGFPKENIIDLDIFDYLSPNFELDSSKKLFNKDITIAGNLSIHKVEYLKYLKLLKKINFHLYGVNYNENDFSSENIIYHGKFNPDALPKELTHGFGLVWDGISADTCDGVFGKYLRYNNPHKLSLYVASGLPIIIWNEAAEAKFVKDNEIGILVESLYEAEEVLQNISEEKYTEYVHNISKLSEKVRTGYFTKLAISAVEEQILNKEREIK